MGSSSADSLPMQREPSPQAPVPFGRYLLIRRIGAGGMGEVFLAREERQGKVRACVVKKVLPNFLQNRAFVGRFLDESKVVVRLRHPNIARVYAMGEVGGEYFLSMEYVVGKTVSRFTRRLRDRKMQMPLGHILLLGERVCEGLAYAHDATDERGSPLHLVHRDLSPANVCVSYQGEVKIIDFGAAHSTLKEEQTAPRVVIGNLTYMAPEQARKQIVDRRADVYSVGVMLWELFAWRPLPQKGDPLERWRRAANPSWEPPSVYRRSVPDEVNAVILRALRTDPADRHPDARALGAELRRLRKKYAPHVGDSDLGSLLSTVFEKERQTEMAILEETLKGVSDEDETTAKRPRPSFVPPTTLAFEHRAIAAPDDLLPAGNRVPARALSRDDLVPTRVGFGLPFAELAEPEGSILEEIEPTAATEAPSSVLPWVLVGSGVFLGAAALGFLGVWAWLRALG